MSLLIMFIEINSVLFLLLLKLQNVLKLSHLRHKNIIDLVGYSTSPDHFYLVHKLVPGCRLADILEGEVLISFFFFFPILLWRLWLLTAIVLCYLDSSFYPGMPLSVKECSDMGTTSCISN